jgi:hypothetical protein
LSSSQARRQRPTLPPGLLPAALGAAGLAAVVALLPILGEEDASSAEQVLGYALAVVPIGVLVFGLLALAASLSTPQVLLAEAAGLARHVNSIGVAFLVAAVATAADDLFSVLAGPTKAHVEEGSPALDFLLVIFPTFGQPLGFALGVANFFFLVLFAAVARYLSLRPLPSPSAAPPCLPTSSSEPTSPPSPS